MASKHIVILTGAGISAQSGVRTFRDSGGLWEDHDIQDVATPEAFARNPALVQNFYDQRRQQVMAVQPNAAHRALACLQQAHSGSVTLITQNVDDLHERAGARDVLHMHGELLRAYCRSCNARPAWHGTLADEPHCPHCAAPSLRPDVVWFGEMPYHMDAIEQALAACDLFAAIGTSGEVHPAAGFVMQAAAAGARTVELNLESSAVSKAFDEVHAGPAATTVPAWVEQLLG